MKSMVQLCSVEPSHNLHNCQNFTLGLLWRHEKFFGVYVRSEITLAKSTRLLWNLIDMLVKYPDLSVSSILFGFVRKIYMHYLLHVLPLAEQKENVLLSVITYIGRIRPFTPGRLRSLLERIALTPLMVYEVSFGIMRRNFKNSYFFTF